MKFSDRNEKRFEEQPIQFWWWSMILISWFHCRKKPTEASLLVIPHCSVLADVSTRAFQVFFVIKQLTSQAIMLNVNSGYFVQSQTYVHIKMNMIIAGFHRLHGPKMFSSKGRSFMTVLGVRLSTLFLMKCLLHLNDPHLYVTVFKCCKSKQLSFLLYRVLNFTVSVRM